MGRRGLTIAALATAGALLAGGGTALAGDGAGKGKRCERLLERIAEKRGVTVAAFEAMLKERALERIEAALKAGRISEERAQELRTRVNEGKVCGLLKQARHARMHHQRAVKGLLAGAADYLGLAKEELRAELRSGKTLKQLAEAKGKGVSGLVDAMLAPVKESLDKAVSKGRITDERRDAILERLATLAKRVVERTFAASPAAA